MSTELHPLTMQAWCEELPTPQARPHWTHLAPQQQQQRKPLYTISKSKRHQDHLPDEPRRSKRLRHAYTKVTTAQPRTANMTKPKRRKNPVELEAERPKQEGYVNARQVLGSRTKKTVDSRTKPARSQTRAKGQIASGDSIQEPTPASSVDNIRDSGTQSSISGLDDASTLRPSDASPESQPKFTRSQTHRTRSPPKADPTVLLQYARNPILQEHFPPSTSLPPRLRDLRNTVRRIKKLQGFIPRSCQASLEDLDDSTLEDSCIYYDDTDPQKTDGPFASCNMPSNQEIVRIVNRSKECYTGDNDEPSWNTRVHTPLLDLALRYFGCEDRVDWANMKTGRISSSVQLPDDSVRVDRGNCRVDFAIVCKLQRSQMDTLRVESIDDLNHTDLNAISKKPIAVNIAAVPAGGSRDARLQLSIWTQSQFIHLRDLFGCVPEFLPLLLVVGSSWYFLAAKQEIDVDEIGRTGVFTTIWGEEFIGDSHTYHGCLQIIAALQVMYRWAALDYISWWEEQLKRITN